MNKFIKGCRHAIKTLVGQINWVCPPWINYLSVFIKSRKRLLSWILSVVICLVGASYFAFQWYQSLPKQRRAQILNHFFEKLRYKTSVKLS
jgi:hypothetical protein